MMRTGGSAIEASRAAVEDLAFRMGRYDGRLEAMSQLGLRGKSFLKGYSTRVSVQDKELIANMIPAYLDGHAVTTYTKSRDKDDEFILRLVCGAHSVFGSARISREVKGWEECTGMEKSGGVYSKFGPMLSR